MDRRRVMMAIDVLSGIVTAGFLLAVQYRSLPLLYTVTAARAACSAMYYPVTTSMVRLLVPDNKQDLLLANTMASWSWSSMAMFGGFLAGSLAAVIGLQACFLVDSLTFFISALLLSQIRGNYSVNEASSTSTTAACGDDELDPENTLPPPEIIHSPSHAKSWTAVVADFGLYLWTCGFAVLTLLKATAALIWGAEDIISTAFAEAGMTTESGTSVHMGLVFSFIGLGCFVGPTVANHFTDTSRPRTLLLVSLVGMCFQLASWLGMWQAHNFEMFLFFTVVRAVGSSIIWVNSTLLLQTLSAKQQLGKVLAVEYFTYTLTESTAASTAGHLADAGVSKNQIALLAVGVAIVSIAFWSYQAFARQLLISGNPHHVRKTIDTTGIELSSEETVTDSTVSTADDDDNDTL